MEFQKATVRGMLEILETHLPQAYPGGSNGSDLNQFKTYVRRKGKQKGFSECLWVRVTNAKNAENRLLNRCASDGCAFNIQSRSNLYEDDGFVYVLF